MDPERLAAAAHALLARRRAGRIELDRRARRRTRYARTGEGTADDEVEHALHRQVEAAELDVGDVEQRDALDVVDERPRLTPRRGAARC